MVVNQPNVQSVVSKEHEGSFLVGVMAAMASKTGRSGCGSMDIPLDSQVPVAGEQGVKYANLLPRGVCQHDRHHWRCLNDPARGGELAKAQFAKGADVGGLPRLAAPAAVWYQAAKDSGKLAIGVDSNQNHLQPGTMLTSMTAG